MLATHLDFLSEIHVQPPPSNIEQVLAWIEECGAVNQDGISEGFHEISLPSEIALHNFLTSLSNSGFGSSESSPVESTFQRMLHDPHVSQFLTDIRGLLSSAKSRDDISSEILDLLGFDHIELTTEIMRRQDTLADLIAQHQENLRTGFSEDATKSRLNAQLQVNASRPLFSGSSAPKEEALSHVYTSSSVVQSGVLSHLGTKYLLPLGTERIKHEEYEEVIVPPARPVPPRATEKLISVDSLDPLAKGCFSDYRSLNRVQSIVYDCAYRSNENMLVCAPTGAGKTDVAMLTVLRVISQHLNEHGLRNFTPSVIRSDDFKIIYVAPMKALASEIVRKFSKRLAWLRIKVRELTGDMQMTKGEIAETQMIVTTPEKWDVVTRKPTGEGEITAKVRLLIIDEVHLLNDDRGAVIEALVARTLRMVESSQSMIRILGLSATLPNFVDVADFLRVSRQTGLFYFDSSFRPIPLEQHFIGVKGKIGSPEAKKNLDKVTFDKVAELAEAGHQVMVFVHARKETVKTALALKEAASIDGSLDNFSCMDDPLWETYRREMSSSKNKEMKQLFEDGFGIHHAGMLRSDRNLMEKLFLKRAIKVLCCTATLAWGVNLPAHAVVIKGTQVYDSGRGAFSDLSVLDVLQIFGRAGRPGLESDGEGFILTNEEKLTHYLEAVTAQHPIESRFVAGIVDSLNAEISLGTVTTVSDAVRWIGYTYLFVRMKRNPLAYGMVYSEISGDPGLSTKRRQLVIQAAQELVKARMISFNEMTESFAITERGQIAARYYIRYQSVEIFNKEMHPIMTEADVLRLISKCIEFEQLQLRESEVKELKGFLGDQQIVPCEINPLASDVQIDETGGVETHEDKVNILLQAYISQAFIEDFALVSDTLYVAQNGGRITRALLEIALSNKWASVSVVLMGISKAIEKRMWPFQNPLCQFPLSQDLLHHLMQWADDYSPADLLLKSAKELGDLIHMNERNGSALQKAVKQLPSVSVRFYVRPLNSELVRLEVDVEAVFTWDARVHGFTEPFWLWVEDVDGVDILQLEHLVFQQEISNITTSFHIPVPAASPLPKVKLRHVSDKWLGSEGEIDVPLLNIKMPAPSSLRRQLLDLPLLSITRSWSKSLQQNIKRKFAIFNAIQTQAFWSIVNSMQSVVFSGPAGCGKSTLGYISLIQSLVELDTSACCLCIEANPASAKQAFLDLRDLCHETGVHVEGLLSTSNLSTRQNTIFVSTPGTLLTTLQRFSMHKASTSTVVRVMLDSLENLHSEYELAISLLLHILRRKPVKMIGLATSLNDAADLANWLHVAPGNVLLFRPNDRDISLSITAQAFPYSYSVALFKAMSKPLYTLLKSMTTSDQTLVFLPSRAVGRSTGNDLLTRFALEEDSRGFIAHDVDTGAMSLQLSRMADRSLAELLLHGIGLYDGGQSRQDASLVLRLYAEGIIRVLLIHHKYRRIVPVRGNVIIFGTEYPTSSFQSKRKIVPYDILDLFEMQSRAARHGQSGKFHIFCPVSARPTILRLLNDGLSSESQLPKNDTLRNWLKQRLQEGQIRNKQDALDFLSSTYLALRLVHNPDYYDVLGQSGAERLSRVIDNHWTVIDKQT